jgi:enamine deaminase RidA (YjgF/YER057c/UK114 family)
MKTKFLSISILTLILSLSVISCKVKIAQAYDNSSPETPDYFLLRLEVEKAYGYSHAVKIGNHIKISGAVSMDDEGNAYADGNPYIGPDAVLNGVFARILAEHVLYLRGY